MLRFLRKGGLLALALPLVICGAAYAGGADCNHGGKAGAVHAGSEKGVHCNLAKNVTKAATMTENGAVITMEGKTEEAVKHIQEHLGQHQKAGAADCPDCPFSMEGVTATVKLTEKGGEVTMVGSDEKAIKKVQTWAKKPAGDCCGKSKSAA